MLTLIKNTEVYAPHYLGRKDVLLAANKIGYIKDTINLDSSSIDVKIIDGTGKLLVPGFIDAHVHLIGGGGEGGFKTRTPELNLTDATTAGITTVVGVLGTDGTTRRIESLLAKAHALDEEGITAYIHSGSYQIPVKTLTGKIEEDLIFIEKILGVGEIAISDHRSSEPAFEELVKIAAAARNGGLITGKAGLLEIHVGDSDRKLDLLFEIAEKTDIPMHHFHPTHINRNAELFEEGIRYTEIGGYVDLTTSTIPHFLEEGEVKCSKGLRLMLERGVSINQITFSSDGQASLPYFNEDGDFAGLQVGRVSSLFKEVRSSVLDEGIPLESALQVITSNPARILKLINKGEIREEKDADLVLLDKEKLTIDTVIAKGKVMVEGGVPIIKGTFEN
ncbi:beta-aspartyl-peptidase [Metabacillus dongyingensis]|uniref:beta-aspartyl-peptidase n=1 Tax=Metabacillus dongyingensis TaxID=2874282 RepID=UPI001CBCBE86|nr:beta-aspartyl-peptidase [Metabacillus dongyingensis]UAL53042.1 beta-aspartyl-peptidase [Metabacillus dongyingensis]